FASILALCSAVNFSLTAGGMGGMPLVFTVSAISQSPGWISSGCGLSAAQPGRAIIRAISNQDALGTWLSWRLCPSGYIMAGMLADPAKIKEMAAKQKQPKEPM